MTTEIELLKECVEILKQINANLTTAAENILAARNLITAKDFCICAYPRMTTTVSGFCDVCGKQIRK